MAQRTIFITVSEPFIIKSILRTNFAKEIRVLLPEARLVLITTPALREQVASEFGPRGFVVESFEAGEGSFFDTVLSFFSRAGFSSGMNEVQQRREWSLGRGRIPPVFKRIFAKTIGRTRAFTSVLRALDQFVAPCPAVVDLLDRYKPDTIFSTVLMYAALDTPLLREAKRRGTTTLAMTRSWDNLTGWGYIRVVPDRFLAQNEFIFDIGARFQNLDRTTITVVGIPHYDMYLDSSLYESRKAFCDEMSLDPEKKIITYGAVGEPLFRNEGEMADILAALVNEKKITPEAQVIFRPHPAYVNESRVGSFAGVTLDSKQLDSLPHLINVLRHTDVLVTAGSTLIIDASCFDKPVVTVAFDGKSGEKDPWFSTARFYEYFDHLRAVFRNTRGARIVRNEDELAREVNAYLADHARDKLERAKIVRYFASPFDGKAGLRLAEIVATAYNQPR